MSEVNCDSLDNVSRKRKLSECDTESVDKNGHMKTKRNEMDYFLAYADIELHRTMIEDNVRTSAYRDALLQRSGDFIKDKVVVDVGCGTGILSMFCAQAGAKKVYAIDASEIALHAQKLVKANGFEDIIQVIHGRAEDIELPEKVDVIVSEWMGYMMLYETMLPSVLKIRDKYLKPGGKMYPERAVLKMALAETNWLSKYEENAYDFWISLTHTYSLDMSLLADQAVTRYKNAVHIHMVPQEDVISFPSVVCDLDLYKISEADLIEIKHDFRLPSMGSRVMNSIVLWFDVFFPHDITLSTSPDLEETHWQNVIITLNDANVKQDTVVSGSIKISQDDNFYRHQNINIEYSIDDGPRCSRKYKMDDSFIE